MKILVCVAISFLACGAGVVVAVMLQGNEPPRLVVPSDRYDFGEVLSGSLVEHSFVLKNEGEGTLKIYRVNTSCGCATTSYPREIGPGKTGSVHLVLDTTGLSSMHKRAELFTNDPDKESVRLWVTGSLTNVVTVGL